MKTIYKITLVLASIAAAAMSALPVMSVHLSDGESCTLFVRGYNLTEFSAWGCIPLLAPLFIPMILIGHQPKAAKELMLIALFIGNMVCYTFSIHVAQAWLTSLGGSRVTFHPGTLVIPFAFAILLVLAKIFDSPTYTTLCTHKIRDDAGGSTP